MAFLRWSYVNEIKKLSAMHSIIFSAVIMTLAMIKLKFYDKYCLRFNLFSLRCSLYLALKCMSIIAWREYKNSFMRLLELYIVFNIVSYIPRKSHNHQIIIFKIIIHFSIFDFNLYRSFTSICVIPYRFFIITFLNLSKNIIFLS